MKLALKIRLLKNRPNTRLDAIARVHGKTECPTCFGTGGTVKNICGTCNGKGYI